MRWARWAASMSRAPTFSIACSASSACFSDRAAICKSFSWSAMARSIFSVSRASTRSPRLTVAPCSTALSTLSDVHSSGRRNSSVVFWASKTPSSLTSMRKGPFLTFSVAGLASSAGLAALWRRPLGRVLRGRLLGRLFGGVLLGGILLGRASFAAASFFSAAVACCPAADGLRFLGRRGNGTKIAQNGQDQQQQGSPQA